MGSGPVGQPLRRLGKYELLARLAAGGMAEVYLARLRGPMNFQKAMVVKIIHPHLASEGEFLRMLFDEARLSALIKHPNVVDIYELGCEDGIYFLAMEHIDGQPLSAIMRAGLAGDPLGPFGTARIVADAAGGLHAAHELCSGSGELIGLVHRDVSPGNIMVRYDGGVKIVDFGIAKARGRLTVSGVRQFKGKAGYVAPEQLESGAVDRRTDVFGLGVVLWEALALRRFNRAADEKTALREVLERRPPSPSSIRSEVPEAISEICLKAMQPAPEDRYQSAGEMKRALDAVLIENGFYRESGHVQAYMERVFAQQQQLRQKALRKLAAFTAAGDMPPLDVDVEVDPDEDYPDLQVADDGEAARRAALARGTTVEAEAERVAALADGTPKPAAQEIASEPEPRRRRSLFPYVLLAAIAIVGAAIAALLIERQSLREQTAEVASRSRGDQPTARARAAGASRRNAGAAIAGRAGAEKTEPVAEAVEGGDDSAAELASAGDDPAAAGDDTAAEEGEGDDSAAEEGEGDDTGAEAAIAETAPAAAADRRQDRPAAPRRPARSAAAAYEEGAALFIKGQTAKAKELFKESLAADRRYAPAHRGLGLIYARQGRRAKAKRHFERYLALRPSAGDADSIRKRIEQLSK